MTKRKHKIIITIAIVLILSIGWHYYAKRRAALAGGMPPTPVVAIAAKLQNWQQQVQATGSLNAFQGVMLKSEVAGRVTKINFSSGQTVKAGDLLLEIDPGILQAQLVAAQAKATLSSGDYQRAIELFKRGVLAKQDLDTALSTQNSDAANVDALKAQLAQNIIVAPFDGRLGLRLINLGDYISPGKPLVNLQTLNPMRVDFSVSENYLGQIAPGDKLQIQSDAFPNQIFTGNVKAIDSAVDPATRTISLRAIIANPEGKLLPGSFVQVTLMAGKPQLLITIPQLAVVYDSAGNYVYVINHGHAAKKIISIVQQNDTQVAVTGNIKAGDQVITEGQLKIMDGAPVIPMPASNSSGS